MWVPQTEVLLETGAPSLPAAQGGNVGDVITSNTNSGNNRGSDMNALPEIPLVEIPSAALTTEVGSAFNAVLAA
ncbi:hypothetical protein E8E15_000838 [Penicillium rubens]|nr:hypothetical protein E8E15_000838 [Penicillium rubens]